jgi:hypothetical protein
VFAFAHIPVSAIDAVALPQKLAVSQPGDTDELEADRVAKAVLAEAPSDDRRPPTALDVRLNRRPELSHHKDEPVHIKGSSSCDAGRSPTPPTVREVLNSRGQPLDAFIRASMESRLGHDFSRVQVHSGAAAEQSAQDLGAKSYTVGAHIVFGASQYAPQTQAGRQTIAHELAHVMQQGRGGPMVHREAAGKEFEPCRPAELDQIRIASTTVGGGPFTDQRVNLPYDKLVPLPNPRKGYDEKEVKRTFTDSARLEQLYYDATTPNENRSRAVWLVCNAVESGARYFGASNAAQLYSIGCLTYKNCGMDWEKALRDFSEATASGRRVRGVFVKGFVDKAFELDVSLSVINNALLLLAGLSAAGKGLGRTPGGGSTPPKTEPPTTGTPKSEPPKVEPPKTGPMAEAPKPTVASEQPKPPTAEAPKPTVASEQPSQAPPKGTPSKPEAYQPRTAAEVEAYLRKQGLTDKEILGFKGGKRAEKLSAASAARVERLLRHFTTEDLKALGNRLSEKGIILDDAAVETLIKGVSRGEMSSAIRKSEIAEVHGEKTRVPEAMKEKSIVDDPNARAQTTKRPKKPSPGPEPREFRRGNFAHRFAEFIFGRDQLPRPNRAEVVIDLHDGTGDIIRTDRISSTADAGVLLEIKPAGKSAAKGRAELPGRLEAVRRYYPKKNGWTAEVLEYTRADVEAWLREEARAARASGKPVPDVAGIMKLFGF